MKEKEIKALLVKPLCQPQVITLENKLETFQSLVGGYIDVWCPEDEVDYIFNDEGKILGLKPNRVIARDENGTVIDFIAGDFVIVGSDLDSGEFTSLPDEKIHKYFEEFRYPEGFLFLENEDGRIEILTSTYHLVGM